MLLHFIEDKFKRIFFYVLLGMFGLSLHAQTVVSVSGVVRDAQGEAVTGASVVVRETNAGTTTDQAGSFTVNVPQNGTFVVSFVGYISQEISIGSERFFQITMEEDSRMLDELVVIGYGQVRRGDVTGSLTTIKPDELNRGMRLTAQDALIGKVAGVNIVPGNGAPGSVGTIRIRMGASLSATNDPLIVIDGIPVAGSAPLSSINPNDIETFTVLKDASATAIYGSRASNGVIIITTKKGSAAQSKPMINYSANFTLTQVPGYFEVLSADEYRRVFAAEASAPVGFELGTASTDWQKEIFRTGFGMDHNVSVTGNTRDIPYRASIGYLNQTGTLSGNDYQRFNGSIAASPSFLDRHLTLDINVSGSLELNNQAATGAIGAATFFDPTRPIYQTNHDDMGLGYFMWLTPDNTAMAFGPTNPLAEINLTERFERRTRSIGNFAANYKIHGFEDLSVKLSLGYDIFSRRNDESTPDKAPGMYTGNRNDGRGREYWRERDNRNYLFNAVATYAKDIDGKHSINAMAGYEWQRFWYKDVSETIVRDVEDNSFPDEAELYLLSFFGRLNYSFAHKFLLTATLRADATSRFAPENRWGFFPSAALAYRISEEDFLKNNRIVSNLKLRLSYGQTGQQDVGGYYLYLGKYTVSTNDVQYLFGNQWINMYRPDGYNPNIKWETTATYNAGIDYGFFNNRVSGSIDIFKRFTTDLLNVIDQPAGSNFTNRIASNIGNMESNGVELSMNFVPVNSGDWRWTLGGNFTYSASEITKLNVVDNEENHVNAGWVDRNYLQIHKVGNVPYTFFLLRQAYDNDGKPLEGQYIDSEGNITTVTSDANKYVTGKSSRMPYYYGLSTNLAYKQFDFGINGHGAFGFHVLNYRDAGQQLEGLISDNGFSQNISRRGAERGFRRNQYWSDMFLEKGAFFKVDNITFGYTISTLWNTASSLRVALSAQNVITMTGYTGLDPEIYSGIDNSIVYQLPRIYTLSLNLNF